MRGGYWIKCLGTTKIAVFRGGFFSHEGIESFVAMDWWQFSKLERLEMFSVRFWIVLALYLYPNEVS